MHEKHAGLIISRVSGTETVLNHRCLVPLRRRHSLFIHQMYFLDNYSLQNKSKKPPLYFILLCPNLRMQVNLFLQFTDRVI